MTAPINLLNADTLKKPKGTPLASNGKAYSTGEIPGFIISGELATLGDTENAHRSASIKVDLIKALGAGKVKQVRGSYKGTKETAFVVNGGLKEVTRIGELYDQESVLHLDSSRNAVLHYLDPRHPDGAERIGRFVAVPVEEALASEAFTFDIDQNTYYIVK